MNRFSVFLLSLAIAAAFALPASGQAMFFSSATTPDTLIEEEFHVRSIEELEASILLASLDSVQYDTVVSMKPLPLIVYTPAVYSEYIPEDSTSLLGPDFSGDPAMRWIEEQNATARAVRRMQRNLYYNYPQYTTYNINLLPEAPKKFIAVVNPEDHTISIEEEVPELPAAATISAAPVKQRHWIRSFNALLQFSQAYVSPNWYQGGNNNLNMLATIYYNVKLNQEYHKNLLFETTMQYKLGMNSAPDDTIHNYSISEDILQINTTFGLKAAKRWYYSFTGQFKTQVLNSYPTNSREVRSAFLSPAELTLGIGMTYNYANAKKTVTFDASIAPLSYNLKTCVGNRVDPTLYGIEAGRHSISSVGSSAELKFFWRLAYNITFNSRVFTFTDYSTFYADWENRLTFDINKFLSTQVYAHARYDTATPKCDDPSWKKLQVKEILSIGFSYKFSSL